MSARGPRARDRGGDTANRPAGGPLRRPLIALLLALVLAIVLGLLGRGDVYAVTSCLKESELLDEVDNGSVGAAEDIDALGAAPQEADDFVSAADSRGREIYVLFYDSVSEAESAQALVAPDLESGARGNTLVVFSPAIGNQDRLAVERCFVEEDAEE